MYILTQFKSAVRSTQTSEWMVTWSRCVNAHPDPNHKINKILRSDLKHLFIYLCKIRDTKICKIRDIKICKIRDIARKEEQDGTSILFV